MIGMIDEFEEEGVRESGIEADRIPVFLIEVKARRYIGVRFAEGDGLFGITFEGHDEIGVIQSGDGKNFAHHFKDEGDLIEGEGLFDPFFGEAIRLKSFDVHAIKIGIISEKGVHLRRSKAVLVS
jgi:hypothetical protein